MVPALTTTQAIHLLLFAVLVLLPTNALSNSLPPTSISFPPLLQKRQTCSDTTTSRCPSPASRFCCPTSAECIPLNNATSVICCPSGEDCSFIQPITCTNSDSDSDSGSDENPSQCGSNGQCCPVGYDCDTGSGGCKLKDENKPESYKLREECAKINSSGDSGSGTESQTCTALIEATKESCLKGCKQFPVKAIIAGFFPGLAVGAVIMFVIGMVMRKREMKTMESAIAAAASGHGGAGGVTGDNTTTGRSTSASEYKDGINISILNNAGSGFAAARASRRTTNGGGGYSTSSNNSFNKQKRTRSTGAATTLTSTEIAIGYDRKQDEQFSFVSGSGRGTPVSGSIVTSPTPPPPASATTQQAVAVQLNRIASGIGSINSNSGGGVARGYDSDLRSPRHFIPEELAGSMPSIELDTTPPSSNKNYNNSQGNTTRGAAARRNDNSTSTSPTPTPAPPNPPLPRSRTTPSPIPPPSGSAIPLSTLTAKKPLPAPLTYEHLLQHQKHHSALASATTSPVNPSSATRGVLVPKAQSSYRSSDDDASSFAATDAEDSASPSDDEKQIKSPRGENHPDDPSNAQKRKKKKKKTRHQPADDTTSPNDHAHSIASPQPRHRIGRLHRPGPPSDVTSCITDGDQYNISHDPGVDPDIMSTYPLPPLPLTGQRFSPSYESSPQYPHHPEQFPTQAAGGLTSLTSYSELTAAGVIGIKPPMPRVSQVGTKSSSVVLGEGEEDEEGRGRYSGYDAEDGRYAGREKGVVMDWRRGEPPPP